jgi:hypothetical protein
MFLGVVVGLALLIYDFHPFTMVYVWWVGPFEPYHDDASIYYNKFHYDKTHLQLAPMLVVVSRWFMIYLYPLSLLRLFVCVC